MAATIKIPTIFTAEDRFSKVLRKMSKSVTSFSSRGRAAISRFDTRVTKSFKKLGKLGQMALGVGIGGLFTLAIANNIAYDKSIQSIQAVTGKSGKAFDKYREQILSLGNSQKLLYADVAKSMEIVGSAQPELLENARALAKVTDASLTLSKAGNMSQEEAALALTSVMNQYGAGAKEAQKYIDILATSEKKGSSIIKNTSEALIVAGGTARAFGLSFEGSNAFIQAFAKGGKLGSEAGTQFSGVLSKLSKVSKKEFNPAFTNAFDVMQNLKDANLSYTDLLKMTDSQGAKWITTLLNQNDVLQKLRGNLNDVGQAKKAATEKTNTFDFALKSIQRKFFNYTTSTDNSSKSTQLLKDAMFSVAENIDKVVISVAFLIGAYALMKAITLGVALVSGVLNIALGINTALRNKNNMAIAGNIVAINAYKVAMALGTVFTWLATAATTAFAFALNLGLLPILLIIAAVIALVFLFKNWGLVVDWVSVKWTSFMISIGGAWDNLTEWFTSFSFVDFFKEIGQSIINFMLLPLKSMLWLVSKMPGKVGKMGTEALEKINDLTGNLLVSSDDSDKKALPSTAQASSSNISESIRDSRIRLDVKDPGNYVEKITQSTDDGDIPISMSNTIGMFGY